MKLLLSLSTLFYLSISLLLAQESNQIESLQQILNQDVADQQFAGVVAGIVKGKQKIIVSSGYRDLKSKAPFEQETINRIASISKPMTAIAALQLYEQGLLDLDEPIATYLPSYPKQHASRISTRQLLLHSSGIGAYQSRKEVKNQTEFSSLAEAASVFQERDLVDEPGNAEHYTTYGYVVLGMVIEAVSGQRYEDYMKEHIWDKVGMPHTRVEHLDLEAENKSNVYHRTKRGKVRPSKMNNLSNRVPGGGIHSTAEDLLAFGQAVIHHQLISESTFEMMMTEPGLPYEGNPYGMGWFLYGDNPNLGPVYGHGGAQTGCSSVLLIFPEQDATIVVLSNTANAFDHVFGIAIKHMFPMLKEME